MEWVLGQTEQKFERKEALACFLLSLVGGFLQLEGHPMVISTYIYLHTLNKMDRV